MPNKTDEHDQRSERGNGAEPDVAVHAAEAAGEPSRADTAPLEITAVEIENFKGIGAPVRIDLRPITLLFGNNSAGKSTILHALCYAHEILSHRNADVHKTEIGGDQIDLGGFRQFVHGHDPDRVVRLRFELDLDRVYTRAPLDGEPRRDADREAGPWYVRESLRDKLFFLHPDPYDYGEDDAGWKALNTLIFGDPPETPRSGWVEIETKMEQDRPVLASYAVGANDALVGRIHARRGKRSDLEFNPGHPYLESILKKVLPGIDSSLWLTPDSRGFPRVSLDWLSSALPDWEEPLHPNADDWKTLIGQVRERRRKTAGPNLPGDIRYSRDGFGHFCIAATILLSEIGRNLRDELKHLRYVGPIRNLHPHRAADSSCWADGSAAWALLRNHVNSDLFADTNRWLGEKGRLDTGYALRNRSTVTIADDVRPVRLIQEYRKLRQEFGDATGAVDLDAWVCKKAKGLPEQVRSEELEHQDVAAQIKASDGADINWATPTVEAARREYRRVQALVSKIENRDFTPTEIDELVTAVAAKPTQSDLELVTTKTGLPVRTSDVGVGISQILPVVVAALDPNHPGITAIEQPELHVHPRMQVELGDLFAQGVDRGGIFLIETHSEHLILRLLRRIEETHGRKLPEGKPALEPKQVSVVFLEQSDGEIAATSLRIDEDGEFIDRWPRGFFRERAAELF